MSCAGIAERQLKMLSQSAARFAARIAEKICAHAKIAASFFPAPEVIAANRARSRRQIKTGQIFAIGFL